jgi:hypothetical protein
MQYIQGLCEPRLSRADYAIFLVASATTVIISGVCRNERVEYHYHMGSKAFSMSKNTAAVEILFLKLRVTWSCCDVH